MPGGLVGKLAMRAACLDGMRLPPLPLVRGPLATSGRRAGGGSRHPRAHGAASAMGTRPTRALLRGPAHPSVPLRRAA